MVVIGAGSCGAFIANELFERGKSACIVDAAQSAGTACSSQAYAIAHLHIGHGLSPFIATNSYCVLAGRGALEKRLATARHISAGQKRENF
ncbi:FAD-dependent oxidoreductase [Polynucleobacter necessarius]|uniref:FAD-dependent oxidoreductase n=1 Tax=Polynucleobacter necessarius TaxID=576610 RepID=UPI0039E351B5